VNLKRKGPVVLIHKSSQLKGRSGKGVVAKKDLTEGGKKITIPGGGLKKSWGEKNCFRQVVKEKGGGPVLERENVGRKLKGKAG